MKKIAVILPAHNEAANIPVMYRALVDVFKSLGRQYGTTFLFVDDGSTDSSWTAIDRLGAKDKRVRGIRLSRNFGHQVALEAGLAAADAEAVIMIDCDGQHPVALIPTLIKRWEAGALIVNTIRRDASDTSLVKRWTARLFYGFMNKFSETRIEPGSADFRLIDRRIADLLKAFPEKVKFYRGLINWIGFDPVTVEYVADARWSGTSSYTLGKMYKLATDGLTGFSNFPLQISKYLGLLAFVAGGTAIILMSLITLINHTYFPIWVYLIVSLLLLSGLQFIFLWFIGSYIGRIYMQQNNRPSYLIRQTRNI